MRLLALLAIFLTACGGAAPTNDIVVRRYEDVNGNPTPNADSLGLTYYSDDGGSAKHGEPGFNCLINADLVLDDRIEGVIIHELENALVLKDGDNYTPDYPVTMDVTWFLWDGDIRALGDPIPDDEAAWLASHGTMNVHVADAWLVQPVADAIEKVNDAAGRTVFK